MKNLPPEYYHHQDVVFLARDLLGKVLVTNIGNQGITGGIITETEAYAGIIDRASHAYGGRRTKRTETLFMEGGVAYVYLCYGIHHLFNVVTNEKEIPQAILIRSIEPITGLETMSQRTGKPESGLHLLDGPGKLTKALGITIRHDKISLSGNKIWIEEHNRGIKGRQIIVGPRVGVDYAKDHAHWQYRFRLK